MFLAEITSRSVTFLLLGVLAMILLSVSLVVFFIIYQRRIQAQEKLRQQQEKAYQKALLTAAVEVQEAERRRIASDLHDGIGSLLSATRLYLRQLKPHLSGDKGEEIKDASLEILDEVIQNTRRITHDLLPPVLEKFGFPAAAEDLIEKVSGSTSIKMSCHLNQEQRLNNVREVALYRILQELINNSLKHAAPNEILIADAWQPGGYFFTYSDDGKGFVLNESEAAGLGLRNIESRVTVLNGELKWTTSPGAGLEVNIYLPL